MIASLLEHAARFHPHTEIVSRLPEGPMHRTTWGALLPRAKQVANALAQLGVQVGDRVATLAWNSHRHLTLYYGVSGTGAVLHTVNPRLFPEQITYIVNHAQDKVLFFDVTFAKLVEQLAPQLPSVQAFVAMTDRAHMPAIDVPNLLCYEALMDAQSADYSWPELDEKSASSLCYTSGTTGNPKGVLYSHRSTVLHALMELAPDTFGISSSETLMLIVPMFHANAWGLPYAALMAGADIVMPEGINPPGDYFRVDARIVIWEEPDVLQVPSGALFRQGAHWAVYVIEDGRAVLRLVELGRMSGTSAQVLNGLAEQDQVIVHPSDKVKDGVSVLPRAAN